MSYVDDYLEGVPEPRRAVLEHVRAVVHELVPDAEEGKSYSMPAFKYRGKGLLGFISARQHLSIFPFSGEVVERLADRLDGFSLSSGTIRFSVERPLPDDVLRDVVRYRLEQIERTAR